MIVLSAAPAAANVLLERLTMLGVLIGCAAWLLLVIVGAPGYRWVELEWPIARDPRRSIYARYVPADDRPASRGLMRVLIRAATALLALFNMQGCQLSAVCQRRAES
jgi:hypothetical protein